MCVYTYIYIYVCVYMYMYVCMYVCMYIHTFFFKWQNVYLYSSFFFSILLFLVFVPMSNHIFVLSNQNGDLIGHMSFQKKKNYLQPCSPFH